MNIENLVDRQFNYLLVVSFSHIERNDKGRIVDYFWNCKCLGENCGKIIKVSRRALFRGRKSCGCQNKVAHTGSYYHGGVKTHGMSNTRIYKIYHKMLERCYYDKNSKYYNKITVCEEWRNKETGFLTFYNWAIESGYRDNLSIDRINNYGNYCPENCRWATNKEQANNKTNNVIIEFNGERKTLAEWADYKGWSTSTIYNRYKRKWPIEKMLTEPPRYQKNK